MRKNPGAIEVCPRTTALLGLLTLLLGCSPNGSITGKVTQSTTGTPIEGATVKVRGTQAIGLTDAQGVFTLSDVPPGELSVSVTAEKYVPIPDQKYTLTTRQELSVGMVELLPYPSAIGFYDSDGTVRISEYPSSASRIDCIVRMQFLGVSGLDIGATTEDQIPVLSEPAFLSYIPGVTGLEKLEIWGPVEKLQKCGCGKCTETRWNDPGKYPKSKVTVVPVAEGLYRISADEKLPDALYNLWNPETNSGYLFHLRTSPGGPPEAAVTTPTQGAGQPH